jgi:outer membrane protein OmpA-like peptidoglycan-associated protein
MDIPLIAFLAPRVTARSTTRLRGAGRCGVIAAAFGFAIMSGAQAQVLVGGERPPSVTIDQSVLDALGPPPTLPQLFGAREPQAELPQARPRSAGTASRPSSRAKKTPAKPRNVVRHRARSSKLARKPAPARAAVAKSPAKFHLTPPVEQAKSESPATTPAAPSKISTTTAPPPEKPAVAETVPPPAPPMPALPQSAAVPAPPVVPPAPPHVEAPNPPPQPKAAAPHDSPIAPPTPPPAPASAKPTTPPAPTPPAPVHVASVATIGSALHTVKFAPGATEVPPGSQPALDAVAAKLLANDSLRVQLIAHATGGTDEAMEARRVSLARAVAVRAYLIEKGVRSLRMDVRALGNRSDEGPATDEVDLVVVSQ